MNNLDLAPLWRSTIGFDRFFDLLEDSLRLTGEDSNYPPYNIVKTGEDRYAIALAVAGFGPEEITVTAEQNTLTVEGRKALKEAQELLYQGISARPFRHSFRLADHVHVEGASFENGLLTIQLLRALPEAMKPRRIPIASGAPQIGGAVEHKQAA